MLHLNKLSSKSIAVLASVAISLLASVLIFIFTNNYWHVLTVFFVLWLACYFCIVYVLEKYIYRNIKLIYKFISKEKESIKEKRFNGSLISEKTIDDVRTDVEIWAIEKRSEIQKLQGNEVFRKEFLMNLAHELRTPIFSIQGYIATLLDGEINNPEVNVKFLERAALSADRLSALVDDVDKISRYESNRIQIEKELFSIQALIKEVFEELLPKAALCDITMAIKKGSESEKEVYADREKIKQVLLNLIENAIKYGKDNGKILAGVYEIDQKEILVEITDNGMGIESELTGRVFERFFRTDDARAKDNKGNGLGLAIAKHIVEAHGHDMTCRSTLGKGSTFGFTLEKSLGQ